METLERRLGELAATWRRERVPDLAFATLAREWMTAVVIPRLAAVARLLPNAVLLWGPECLTRASIALPPRDGVPSQALVTVSLAPTGPHSVRILFAVSIVPEPASYNAEMALDLGLAELQASTVRRFLDQCLARFVRDYAEPNAQDEGVTDPMCGATLLRSEAACTLHERGSTYCFCSEGCRARFEGAEARR